MANYIVMCDTCGGERTVFRGKKEFGKWPKCCGKIMSQKRRIAEWRKARKQYAKVKAEESARKAVQASPSEGVNRHKKPIEFGTVRQQFSRGRTKEVTVEIGHVSQKKAKPKQPNLKVYGRPQKRKKKRKARSPNAASTAIKRWIEPLHRPLEEMGPMSIPNYGRSVPASNRYLLSAGMPGNEETDP